MRISAGSAEEHKAELARIPRLKEEQKILATLSPEEVQRLVHFKPEGPESDAGTSQLVDCHLEVFMIFVIWRWLSNSGA
jgi:hypothetical protein